MSLSRFYQSSTLQLDTEIELSEDVFGHAIRVLRLPVGEQIILFNGDGCDYIAELSQINKKTAFANIVTQLPLTNESPLNIHLGQAISRGDRMDFTLQKSVELGVNSITPLFTERCGVKLNPERLEKKRQQWQKIVNSACEQSGRAVVPEVRQPITLIDWLKQQDSDTLCLNLHPRAEHSIMTLPHPKVTKVSLLIGSEGGLTSDEINQASDHGFVEVLLGPRVLRTETAALTAITALQCRYGDLG